MKINWKTRVWSVKFWLAVGPAIFLLAQAIAAPFGHKLDIEAWGVQWASIINALFGVLALLGIVVDPTTVGVGDSEQAQQYGPLVTTKSAQIAKLQAQVQSLTTAQKTTTTNLDSTGISVGTTEPNTDASKEAAK